MTSLSMVRSRSLLCLLPRPNTTCSTNRPIPMRGVLFSQKIGLAIVLALALQKVKPFPTARAAVVQRGATPFLIGPPDNMVTSTTNNSNDDSETSTTIVSSTKSPKTTSTTSGSASSAQSSSTTSTETTSTSESAKPSDPPFAEDNTKQPSSIKYLVPVFLLIFITLAGWGYSKWYSRKKQDEYEQSKRDHERGEWNKIDGDDDLDEKDPWYAGDSDGDAQEVEWQNINLAPAKSSGAISAAGRGWGWRSTMTAWKSARGRVEQDGEEVDELGQKTIRLIPNMPDSVTYQTLPDLEGRPIDRVEERGSIQALRDKLASLTYRDQGPSRKLDRNRAANKRKNKVEPPSAPAWIQPRATSPIQALSPPLQPHLFFHPSGQSIHGMLAGATGSESGSDYGSDDEAAHARFPTISSTASALENNYTAMPERSKSRRSTTKGSTEGVVDDDGGSTEKTPRAKSTSKRNATTPARALEKTPTMRRSTATQDLTSTVGRSKTTKEKSTTSTLARSTSPRKKTKSEKKADKAHDKVEDILKASWSDRALASPTSCMSIDGAVAIANGQEGSTSPGVEEAAVLGGMGGIEQRLAMLRNVEI